MNIKERIIEKARELDIDLIRFTDAGFHLRGERSHTSEVKTESPFYLSPEMLVKNPKTIIVAAECYLVKGLRGKGQGFGRRVTQVGGPPMTHSPACGGTSISGGDQRQDPSSTGKIVLYTQYNVYKELKEKLKKLAGWLDVETGGKYHFKARSNYRSIAEKEAAARAGLGWYGKNGIIITEEFGSRVVLGVIVTDLQIEPDKPLNKDCGGCTRCIDLCPTKAISPPYRVERDNCLQYISEREWEITDELKKVWGNRLYGCETCQDVCPFNKDVRPVDRSPKYGVVGPEMELTQFLSMDEARFKKLFGENQIGMRGLDIIRRNALLALTTRA